MLARLLGKQTSPNSRFLLSTYRNLGAVLAGLAVLLTLQSDPPKMSTKVRIDRRKDKKGNITLRLRWWFEGKREQLILGVRDDKLGQSYAELVQKQIAHDLRIGIYTSKDKYETPAKRKSKSQDEPDQITAATLFENYAAFNAQDNRLAPGLIGRNKAIASKLRETLGNTPAIAVTEKVAKNAVSMMSETLLGPTVKTYIYLISACWDWAKDTYPSNPWSGCSDQVKNLQPAGIRANSSITVADSI